MKLKVTSALLLIAVAIQVAETMHPSLTHLMAFTAAQSMLAVAEVVTHMLAHGSWGHLLGNFSFGLPFMLYLETKLGSKRFLLHYSLCGLGSLALMSLPGSGGSVIGSSGAIMGAAVGACLAFGDNKRQHLLGVAMVLTLLIPQLAMAPIEDLIGVAVYGHIGGALTAMLLATRLMQSDKV